MSRSRVLALIAALLALAVALAGCASSRPTVTADDAEGRAVIFDCVWRTIAEGDPLLTEAPVDWNESRHRYREQAIAASPGAFYRLLSAMVYELDDPHTAIDCANIRTPLSRGTAGTWAPVGRQAILIADDLTPVSHHDRSYPVLMEVDGLTAPDERIATLVWTDHPHQFQLRLKLADGTEHVRTLDSIPTTAENVEVDVATVARASVVHPSLMSGTRLRTPSTMKFRIDLETAHTKSVRVQTNRPWIGSCDNPMFIAREPDEAALWLNGRDGPWTPSGYPWWYDAQDLGSVGYLRYSSASELATGESGYRIAYLLRKALESLRNRDKLIVDLRYNHGGAAHAVLGLMPWLVRRSLQTNLDGYRTIRPQHDGYRGRIAVLVNSRTASAGEWTAYLLRRYADAVIVGERTSGAELAVEIATMPDGTQVHYSRKPLMELGDDSFQRVGLKPDIDVSLSLDRVRQIGYTAAVRDIEREQFRRACEALDVDGHAVLECISNERVRR